MRPDTDGDVLEKQCTEENEDKPAEELKLLAK